MASSPLRAGIIGAGYIASWHADAIKATPGVELAAVCDVSPSAAKGLAEAHGARAYSSVEDMQAEGGVDAVHILTPPDSHHDLTIDCLKAGLHCWVEKPVAISADQTRAMAQAAKAAGKTLGAAHNFLGMPGYERLKAQVRSGALGRVSMAEINWCFPLPPLRSGPFGLWLMRAPRNLLLELGPHLFAFAVDLFGPVTVEHVALSKPVALPGGGTRPQVWRILARAGEVEVTFNLSLVETLDDRSVTLRGSSGQARFDYASDTLVVRAENTADLILNPFLAQMSQAGQHAREGVVNAARQLTSLNQKSPYGLSFRGAIGAFYDSIASGTPLDRRFHFDAACEVMGAIDAALDHVPSEVRPIVAKTAPSPTVLVIGGTGFIGRHLTRGLVAAGHDVRVLSRGKTGPFDDLSDHVETVGVSLHDKAGLVSAMRGIDTVFNLAKSLDAIWEDALKNDVGVSVGIAEAAMEAGVRRLVYTGTIASYDMSDPFRRITEETGFAADMTDRNLYARSKAECERRLMELHRDRGLPLVIARPGIVVGAGGPLQHWGIGRWHGAGAVRIWGHGNNILPFVLIDDITDGLIRMMESEGAVGQSYNLTGERMMSARQYFDAIHDRLGARIRVTSGSLYSFFLSDAVKHALKVGVLRKKGLTRASLNDWKSRAHFSPFDNAKPKAELGWAPEPDRARFVEKAIGEANLFGF
ncbi:NAD-dependent epimerase/dehydratase family protein [Thalassococcus sp. S3]|uniref:NAD-dependent epimerase/dehydratase family protein n=1 Tax=Thalassococcus sp. S3 TaxID=2017482 RepID=UPI0010241724|nr:NAD-dependent epimerase/dehydratase family protein [Thalassococcus sp. S3]QBF31972.1 oxidoreductase [Thalassococcus sp. S3]